MKRLFQEPLLHFLLIGAALFAVFHYVQPARESAPSSTQIQLSLDDLAQLALLFESKWKREPTAPELERLMDTKVQMEILYREALAMGLDKDDEIVKRRMAQKMQFLAEDAAATRVPTTAELRSWYAKNSDKFAMPTRFSFRHLYFSPDRRAARARDDAIKALAQLAGQPVDAKLELFADPFMFHEYYRDRATDYLSKEFGPQFAVEIAKLPIGSWQGPIESGFGWHLVFVDTAIPGRVPDFEEVEPEAKTAWLAEQKALAWEKTYSEMRAKYTVFLPRPPVNATAAAGPPANPKDATVSGSSIKGMQ